MSMIEVENKDVYSDIFFHTLQHLKSTEAYRHFLEFSRSAGHFLWPIIRMKRLKSGAVTTIWEWGRISKLLMTSRHH